MKSYLFVIPARGGSKGIPHKNIVDVGGKPLIAYSIQAARQALAGGVQGDMVVSTDDLDIARIAEAYGGNVPFSRPADISDDNAKSIEFLTHALDFYASRNRFFEATILLQPTSPLRTVQDILQAVDLYESTGQPSLISAYREDYICDLVSYRQRGNIAEAVSPLHNAGIRRQEHEKLYVRNGAIYITSVAYLQQARQLICDTPALYVMPKSRSINVDTLEDLELLRWYLK